MILHNLEICFYILSYLNYSPQKLPFSNIAIELLDYLFACKVTTLNCIVPFLY